jgi:hypothetical protein
VPRLDDASLSFFVFLGHFGIFMGSFARFAALRWAWG